MNKKFYGTLLLGTLLLGSTIVSCKDYDDDIDNLQNQITQLATKADMQSEVSKLQSAVATAQAAAENKAAAAEQAAKDAAAKAQAAADAAAKAQGTADAAAKVEALEKVAAEAAAAAKAAEEAKAAAEAKAEELASQLAELQALAATLVSTTDFEAAKKELNDKYAELAAKIGETTGTTGLTGLQVIKPATIAVGYGIWDGVHAGATAAEWDGPKKDEVAKLSKGDYISAFGANEIQIAVNPTDVDVTNTEFAVVNQFGEIAPVAFGTPEVLTRANAAGTYKVKIASAALTSDVVKEFGKNFEKGTTGANATLVAGKIASTITKDFVAVSKNENSSVGTFGATVKFDEISGSVEVVATNSENVYDSYITGLKDVSAHDALVWGLKYDGMTLTYNAEAAKKFAVAADKVFKVKVKQINLNGYIHETDATVTFKAKEVATDKVEVEGNVTARTHDVQIDSMHPTTGVALQVETITKAQILEALKIQAGTEAAIHFDHVDTGWTPTAGKAFYYTADNDTVCLRTVGEATATTTDDKKHFTGVKITFTKGYPKANFANTTAGDFLKNGKTLYIPVVLTGKDESDLGNPTEYTYTVNVPVKFQMPSVKGWYKWKVDLTGGTNSNTVASSFAAESPYNGKIAYYEDTATVNSDGKYVPQLTAELDLNSVASYKALVYQIDTLTLNVATTSAITALGETIIASGATVSTTVKTNAKKTLKNLYMNKVYTYNAYDQCFYDTENGWLMGPIYRAGSKITHVGIATRNPLTGVYSYTIKGLKAQLSTLDNRVVALDDVVVTKNGSGSTSTTTMTLTNNTLYNSTSAPYLRLENSARPAVDGQSFNGQFTIVDKYGYEYYVNTTGTITPTTIAYENEFGAPITPSAGAVQINGFAYGYKEGTTPGSYVNTNGLEIHVSTAYPAAASVKKIRVTIPAGKLTRIYDDAVSSQPVTFELELVNE